MYTPRFPSLLACLTPLLALGASAALSGCGEIAEREQGLEKVEAQDGDLMPRYAPADEDFYRMPWPSDARVSAQGTVDVSDIPNANHNFVKRYVEMLSTIRGFSTMPVAYVAFETDTAPPDDAIPVPSATVDPNSPIQLIAMSEAACGERVPVEAVWDAEGDKYVAANTLKVAPVPGYPLRPATPYALIVTTSFGGNDLSTARPEAFAAHLNGDGADEALALSFDPMRDCLPQTNLSSKEIAVASVFTTQDPVAETRKLREMVWSDATEIRDIRNWRKWVARSTSAYEVYSGTMKMPIFQKGEPPYSRDGDLVFDESGRPEIQRWETVPFAVTVPRNPDGPLKLLVWEDGTGAQLASHIGDDHIVGALEAGFAVATFVPQFHKDRGEADYDPELDTFNYINPKSGRTVFRQQVAETSYFIRLIEEKLINLIGLPPIDTSRVFYGGHSQGALVGAMVAGVEPRIDTYMLNGVGSYLSETIIFRKDPFDIAQLVQNLLDVSRPIDRFHPIVAMAQVGADVVDPHNYARYWRGWGDGQGGASVFMINGKDDYTTSTLSMNALMTAAGLPVVGPKGWPVDPWNVGDIEQVDAPLEANRQSLSGQPLTMGSYMSSSTGHFTIYSDDALEDAAVNFWATSAAGSAVIDF
ncbi:hypothetical protein FIV42_19310 [Persicimonas caeni]|uniref:Bacterial virulence factor lipase N-terminal domain-containing protein n=1 Tax=Persicimonas caeni TaxID=2292766 RepID=A0A4Y6PWW0_PERCE|nr:hypothetical protein [Persicimonas caeni]QDG52814.1 hypothetical protein FIV42_19310 [Persicimonas caeni]QED34036.1 hypothetical protein FRD00_19305 [Persicimonas caeni]